MMTDAAREELRVGLTPFCELAGVKCYEGIETIVYGNDRTGVRVGGLEHWLMGRDGFLQMDRQTTHRRLDCKVFFFTRWMATFADIECIGNSGPCNSELESRARAVLEAAKWMVDREHENGVSDE